MRATDNRYRAERERLELALDLIRFEARTGTIRTLTGLSDDRIRRLYSSYFKHRPGNAVRRRRGRTPSQVGLFVKSPRHRFHATTLAVNFQAQRLLSPDVHVDARGISVATGQRLCRAYAAYVAMHREALISIEWAWNLLCSLRAGDELCVSHCRDCGSAYVRDALALDDLQCPTCLMLPVHAVADRGALPA